MNLKFNPQGTIGKFIDERMYCLEDDRIYIWSGDEWKPRSRRTVYMVRVLDTEVAFDSEEELMKFLEGFKESDIEKTWVRQLEWEDYELWSQKI